MLLFGVFRAPVTGQAAFTASTSFQAAGVTRHVATAAFTPVLTVTAAGRRYIFISYAIRLTATNSGGTDSETKLNYVRVSVPGVSFEPDLAVTAAGIVHHYGQAAFNTNLDITATDRVTYGRASFTSALNVGVSGQRAGVTFYDIRLTATNSGGTDSETKQSYVEVRAVKYGQASFVSTLDVDVVPEPTQNTYYDIRLTAANEGGSDDEIKQFYVIVTPRIDAVSFNPSLDVNTTGYAHHYGEASFISGSTFTVGHTAYGAADFTSGATFTAAGYAHHYAISGWGVDWGAEWGGGPAARFYPSLDAIAYTGGEFTGIRAEVAAAGRAGAPNVIVTGVRAVATATGTAGSPEIRVAARATATATGKAGSVLTTTAINNTIIGQRARANAVARPGDTLIRLPGTRAAALATGRGSPAITIAGARATLVAVGRVRPAPIHIRISTRATGTATGRPGDVLAGDNRFISGVTAYATATARPGIVALTSTLTGTRATATATGRPGSLHTTISARATATATGTPGTLRITAYLIGARATASAEGKHGGKVLTGAKPTITFKTLATGGGRTILRVPTGRTTADTKA